MLGRLAGLWHRRIVTAGKPRLLGRRAGLLQASGLAFYLAASVGAICVAIALLAIVISVAIIFLAIVHAAGAAAEYVVSSLLDSTPRLPSPGYCYHRPGLAHIDRQGCDWGW